MRHGASLIGYLTANAVEGIGRRAAWRAVEHLDAADDRACCRRLGRTVEDHVPLSETLQDDKDSTAASLLEVLRSPNWRRQFQSLFGLTSGAWPKAKEEWLPWLRLQVTSRRRFLVGYSAYQDALIATSRVRYPLRRTPVKDADDPVLSMLEVDITAVGFPGARSEAFNRLLLTVLALRAYRADQGQFPGTLAKLAPRYLKSLPEDPFAASGSFHYRRTGAGCLLYSLGPDGKDDGGRPVSGRSTMSDSTGDLVAGVTLN